MLATKNPEADATVHAPVQPRVSRLAVLPALPLVAYSRWSGAPRGRRFAGMLADRLLPRRGWFTYRHPNGATLELSLAEGLGRWAFVFGEFEPAELQSLLACARGGGVIFDVGANVGFHAVALAAEVGQTGRVVAIEPSPHNSERLRSNLDGSSLNNSRIYQCAAGAARGSIQLNLADDPAYLSTVSPVEGRATGGHLEVALRTLDDIWEEEGRPRVAAIKIDVEGVEPDVLRGAGMLLAACQPDLLLEANDDARLAELKGLLEPLGYRATQPAGFEPWNYLFLRRRDQVDLVP